MPNKFETVTLPLPIEPDADGNFPSHFFVESRRFAGESYIYEAPCEWCGDILCRLDGPLLVDPLEVPLSPAQHEAGGFDPKTHRNYADVSFYCSEECFDESAEHHYAALNGDFVRPRGVTG
jgi:hypothetical protein